MYTLTTDDIKALKQADYIIFEYRDGKGDIRLGRRDKTLKDGGRVVYDQYQIDNVDMSFEVNRDPESPDGFGGTAYDVKIIKAFVTLDTGYTQGAALQYYLKVGDSIRVRWYVNNSSGYTYDLRCNHPDYRGQRLYCDMCYLEVVPKGKNNMNWNNASFLLKESVCPDNSARMVQY